jgi:hypothetical protein
LSPEGRSLGLRYAVTIVVLFMVSAGSLSIFAYAGQYAAGTSQNSTTSSASRPTAMRSSTHDGTSYVVVGTQTLHGSMSFGFYVQVLAAGKQIASGYTPATFPLSDGASYTIYVNPYGNCAFGYWVGTWNFTNGRILVPSGNATLTAVMDCGQVSTSSTTTKP